MIILCHGILIVVIRLSFDGFNDSAKKYGAKKLCVVFTRMQYDEGKMTVVCLTLWINPAY